MASELRIDADLMRRLLAIDEGDAQIVGASYEWGGAEPPCIVFSVEGEGFGAEREITGTSYLHECRDITPEDVERALERSASNAEAVARLRERPLIQWHRTELSP
jgi:hypothetical protein